MLADSNFEGGLACQTRDLAPLTLVTVCYTLCIMSCVDRARYIAGLVSLLNCLVASLGGQQELRTAPVFNRAVSRPLRRMPQPARAALTAAFCCCTSASLQLPSVRSSSMRPSCVCTSSRIDLVPVELRDGLLAATKHFIFARHGQHFVVEAGEVLEEGGARRPRCDPLNRSAMSTNLQTGLKAVMMTQGSGAQDLLALGQCEATAS